MPHASTLIATIVVGIGLAFILGTIANRLRISPLVGYLLAGVAVGPFTPGYTADQVLAPQLAEIGVILLMFGVGLHFSLKDLFAIRAIVVPGAIVQVAASAALGYALACMLGWSGIGAIVFGATLSITSTVVLMRALGERHLVDTDRGHIVVGWLVMQDLLMVIVLVLLPPIAAAFGQQGGAGAGAIDYGSLAASLGLTFAKVAGFIGLMLLVGRRAIPMLLHYIAHTGSRELFRLAVLSVALGVAFAAAELFDVSFALGAFIAGMTLSESELSQVAAEESLPLRDAFAVLFFVSVGMLFDPTILVSDPLEIGGVLLLVVVANPTLAFLASRLFGARFILADLGIGLGVLSDEARHLILAGSILSILVNPLIFALPTWLLPRLRRPAPAVTVETREERPLVPTRLTDHAVLIGYGRVGRLVAEGLAERGWPILVIEDAEDAFERAKTAPGEAIQGNAADDRVLAAANLGDARMLLVAIPNAFEAGQIVEQARAANPRLEIVARAHFDAEVEHLLQHGADIVIMGEREIARSMLERAARQVRAES
ncbi:MAG: sodium:proton antiporter [Alphaproteobacteria bacterium]|nr:MAG: sodium:proton antiporter [Alphaproteobacteria bacterium]